MSTPPQWIEPALPHGTGWAVDLGGGSGHLKTFIERHGYAYVNVDRSALAGATTVCADAHALPFHNGTISLVVAKDSLEHFENPWQVVAEIRRVLQIGGTLVLWVPFMHPFHSTDLYRYTPLSLRNMLAGFRIERFESPLWVVSVLSLLVGEVAKRLGLGGLTAPLKELGYRLDRFLLRSETMPRSFAGAYLIVAVLTVPHGE